MSSPSTTLMTLAGLVIVGRAWPAALRPSQAATTMAEGIELQLGNLGSDLEAGSGVLILPIPRPEEWGESRMGEVSDIRTPKYLTGQGKCPSIQASQVAWYTCAQPRRKALETIPAWFTSKQHVMKMSPTSSSEVGCVPSAVAPNT